MQTQRDQVLADLHGLPSSQACKVINFDKAEVRPGFINGSFILVVRGNAPCSDMRVQLMPVVYIQRPDYWQIEVVGCLAGPFCLPEIKPYTETLPLEGVLGTKGVEVVGASRRIRIDVPAYTAASGPPSQ